MLDFRTIRPQRELSMSFSEDTRLPTYLWVEAEMRRLMADGHGVYVAARGDKTGGMVIQKIADMAGRCKLLLQQRDLDGKLTWINALDADLVEEREADDYIRRAVGRDPDLWVVEIEDKTMTAMMKA